MVRRLRLSAWRATVTSTVSVVRDTCNVYVLRNGREAVLVDFGSGAVLDRLDELELDRVTDVLVTHHHRDQVQGLARAVAEGIRIWVPPVEEELFTDVERRWQSRQLDNDYDVRQDRFSLLESVPVDGHRGRVPPPRLRRNRGLHAADARPHARLGDVPRRGSTAGGSPSPATSSTAPGQVWSLAASQWTYSGGEGLASTVLSAAALLDREPDLLAALARRADRGPARGAGAPARAAGGAARPPPRAAVEPRALAARAVGARHAAPAAQPDELRRLLRAPLRLGHRTADRLGLRLRAGTRLGDREGDAPAAPDLDRRLAPRSRRSTASRSSCRPTTTTTTSPGSTSCATSRAPSSGRPENFADVLEQPHRFDLPCLWFDPIPVDRRLPLEQPFSWREYELTPYPLPGPHALRSGDRVRGRRAAGARDGRPAGGRRRARRAGPPQLPVQEPLPHRRLRRRAPSCTCACSPRSSSAATGCRVRSRRPTSSACWPTGAGSRSSIESSSRSARSTSAPRGSARGSSRTARPSRRARSSR